MTEKDKYSRLVKDYLAGKLSDTNRKAFESYAAKDNEFSEYVQAYQEIILNQQTNIHIGSDVAYIQKPVQVQFHKKEQIRAEQDISTIAIGKWRVSYLSLVVGSLAILFCLFFFSTTPIKLPIAKENSPQKLADNYFNQTRPAALGLIDSLEEEGVTSGIPDLVNNAFQKEEYMKSLQWLNHLEKMDSFTITKWKDAIQLSKGICYYLKEDYDSAVSAFKKVDYSTKTSNCGSEARWYLALAYLQKNETQNAKVTLEMLSDVNISEKPHVVHKLLSELN